MPYHFSKLVASLKNNWHQHENRTKHSFRHSLLLTTNQTFSFVMSNGSVACIKSSPNLANQDPMAFLLTSAEILALNVFIQPKWRLAAHPIQLINEPLIRMCCFIAVLFFCSSRGSLFLICQCCCLQYTARLARSKMSGFNGVMRAPCSTCNRSLASASF